MQRKDADNLEEEGRIKGKCCVPAYPPFFVHIMERTGFQSSAS